MERFIDRQPRNKEISEGGEGTNKRRKEVGNKGRKEPKKEKLIKEGCMEEK